MYRIADSNNSSNITGIIKDHIIIKMTGIITIPVVKNFLNLYSLT